MKSRSNSYISLMKIAWKYAGTDRKLLVGTYLLFICANVCMELKPLLYGWFLNSLQVDGANALKYNWIYLAIYIGLYLLQWFLHGPARLFERTLAFRISKNFMNYLFEKLLSLPVDWHKNHHSGSTANRLRKSTNGLRDFFQNGFMYLQTIIQFVISFVAMIYFSPFFGSIAIVIGVFTIILIYLFDKPYIQSLKDINEAEHVVSSTLADSLTNILTVITLKLQKQIHEGLLHKIDKIFPFFRRNAVVGEWKWFVAGLLVNVIYCIMIGGYVYTNYRAGKLFYLGGLATLVGFVTQFTNVFFNIALQYNQIVQYNTDVNTSDLITGADQSETKTLFKMVFPDDWREIKIKNLNFKYKNNRTADQAVMNRDEGIDFRALSAICLTLKKGSKIALTGASGSGKSTLLTVLKGLYPPGLETVLEVDAVSEYDFIQFTDIVMLFPQQPEIFENTVRYNITLGLPYEEMAIRSACDIACFSEIIAQLPEGLETLIMENGVNLSGGQKQRLALARGILASDNSSVILLDESTSNIDQKTELKIYTHIFENFKDKVVLASVHRLHLLPFFDAVYEMENGCIERKGTAL